MISVPVLPRHFQLSLSPLSVWAAPKRSCFSSCLFSTSFHSGLGSYRCFYVSDSIIRMSLVSLNVLVHAQMVGHASEFGLDQNGKSCQCRQVFILYYSCCFRCAAKAESETVRFPACHHSRIMAFGSSCENIVSEAFAFIDFFVLFFPGLLAFSLVFQWFSFLFFQFPPPFRTLLFWYWKCRYCSWWDYKYDWGLLEPGHLLLRSNMKFSPAFYYWAIASNFILRCSWALAVSPNVATSDDLVLFVLQMAEIFRRMQWFIIRVEWESCTTASSSMPVALKTRYTVKSPRSSQASPFFFCVGVMSIWCVFRMAQEPKIIICIRLKSLLLLESLSDNLRLDIVCSWITTHANLRCMQSGLCFTVIHQRVKNELM